MSVATEIVFTELWLSLLMAKPTMHPVFRAMCNKMIAEYPKVFEAYQFSSKTIKEHLKKISKDGTWAETMDIFSCATVLQRTINVYSITSQKWTIFEPCVATQATITCNRSCLCPFTLILHDLHPIANHFNLLEPEGGCCEAPLRGIFDVQWLIKAQNTNMRFHNLFFRISAIV